jgi:hypothetical protein
MRTELKAILIINLCWFIFFFSFPIVGYILNFGNSRQTVFDSLLFLTLASIHPGLWTSWVFYSVNALTYILAYIIGESRSKKMREDKETNDSD